MFHFSSHCKAMESALMRDKKLCRKNRVISSPSKYVSIICKHVANTNIKRSLNQNNTIKLLAPLNSMNIHSKNITHLGKNHYTPNTSTNNIYYCTKIMAAWNTYYIPQFIRNLLCNFCWERDISLWKHMLLN